MLPSDMPLPPPTELNRLIVTLFDYGLPEGLKPMTVVDLLRSTNFGGRIVAHERTLNFARAVGFIEEDGGRVRLTESGRQLLSFNHNHSYELAPGQATYIANHCIFRGPYKSTAASLFRRFYLEQATGKLVAKLPFDPTPSTVEKSLFSFARFLGIVTVEGMSAIVAKPFHVSVMQLRFKRPITNEELELLLAQQKEQGRLAEKRAVEYEKARLRQACCYVESERVTLVSESDITAGYDIASYDGSSGTLEFDRFIEVKSTIRSEPVFIWSANERATAAELGTKYWIYLATSFRPDGQEVDWIFLRDPESECGEAGRIHLDPLTFRALIKELP